MPAPKPLLPLALMILLAPAMALAHPVHDEPGGLLSGLAHPLMGADHLLAMTGVGLWAALSGGRTLWAFPATFIGAMVLGGVIGVGAADLPVVEPTILASVIVLGAATALALRLPLVLSLALLAAFGLAHGYAHGVEGPAGLDLGYMAGFALATTALHLAGLAAGLAMTRLRAPMLVRRLGAVVVAGGLLLALDEAEAGDAKPPVICLATGCPE